MLTVGIRMRETLCLINFNQLKNILSICDSFPPVSWMK